MRRRGFFKTLAAVPAGSALLAQQPAAPLNPAQGIQPPARTAEELPKLEISVAEGAAEAMPRFFNGAQFAALKKVSDVMMPAAGNGSPGAIAAGAPEFLDFLIGDSGADRQRVYKTGLDGLNAQAKKQFNKTFGDLDSTQAATLLAPLRQPWTYDEPADPVARFLRVAKTDIRTATLNSREYGAGRRFAGTGQYWYPLD